jgi:hypothetical protein
LIQQSTDDEPSSRNAKKLEGQLEEGIVRHRCSRS